MSKAKTTHVRMYKKDLKEITGKYPGIRMADFIHVAVKTNPFVQIDAALRKKKKK